MRLTSQPSVFKRAQARRNVAKNVGPARRDGGTPVVAGASKEVVDQGPKCRIEPRQKSTCRGSLRSRPRYLRGGLYALRTLTACFRIWKISSWVNRRVSFTFWRTSAAITTPEIAAAAPG